MNENIDLTKILEKCPKGTKFYSSIFGELSFVAIHNCYDKYPIKLQAYNKSTHSTTEIDYAEDGRSSYIFDGECTIFPSKEQRDWSKFERFWDKPKVERFDPKTFQPFDKVLTRDNDTQVWGIDLYSFYDNKTGYNEFPIVTLLDCWRYAVPYNDETKYLIGTDEDAPEYYKWWKK